MQDETRPVLAKIGRIYDQVQLDDELVVDNGGFCFGLLALRPTSFCSAVLRVLDGANGESDTDLQLKELLELQIS